MAVTQRMSSVSRRFLLGTGIGGAGLLALSACGGGAGGETGSSGGGGGGGGAATITVWMYPVVPDEEASRTYWEGVAADFNADNNDIDLVLELQPWDNRDEKIATALAAGTGPDLVLLTADQTLNYYTSGGIVPVTAALEASDAYFEPTLDSVTYDGDVYGVPIYQTSTTVMYNKQLFDEAGITELPTTWEEVLAAAPALAENGVAILDYAGASEMTLNLSFYPLLWQAGGSVFTEDGTDVAFDSPEGVSALQFLLDLQAMGGLPADAALNGGPIEGGPMGNGTAAMRYFAVKSDVDLMQTAFDEAAIVVGEPLTGVEQASFGTPGVLAVTTINEDLDAAMRVANYIASPDVSHELHVASGTYPVRTDTEAPGEDEITLAFVDALDHARPGEVVPNARQVMAALVPHLQAALQGSKAAQEALDDAAAEARDIISRAG